jgi:hypothetical protein
MSKLYFENSVTETFPIFFKKLCFVYYWVHKLCYEFTVRCSFYFPICYFSGSYQTQVNRFTAGTSNSQHNKKYTTNFFASNAYSSNCRNVKWKFSALNQFSFTKSEKNSYTKRGLLCNYYYILDYSLFHYYILYYSLFRSNRNIIYE